MTYHFYSPKYLRKPHLLHHQLLKSGFPFIKPVAPNILDHCFNVLTFFFKTIIVGSIRQFSVNISESYSSQIQNPFKSSRTRSIVCCCRTTLSVVKTRKTGNPKSVAAEITPNICPVFSRLNISKKQTNFMITKREIFKIFRSNIIHGLFD